VMRTFRDHHPPTGILNCLCVSSQMGGAALLTLLPHVAEPETSQTTTGSILTYSSPTPSYDERHGPLWWLNHRMKQGSKHDSASSQRTLGTILRHRLPDHLPLTRERKEIEQALDYRPVISSSSMGAHSGNPFYQRLRGDTKLPCS
jgi:hypothetical protein